MDFKEWLESESGQIASNTETLNTPVDQKRYLVNRLWGAFTDGFSQGQLEERQRIKEVLEKLLGLK